MTSKSRIRRSYEIFQSIMILIGILNSPRADDESDIHSINIVVIRGMEF
jgi:hypothetical protein